MDEDPNPTPEKQALTWTATHSFRMQVRGARTAEALASLVKVAPRSMPDRNVRMGDLWVTTTMKALAAKAGTSKATVQRAIVELVDVGLQVRHAGPRGTTIVIPTPPFVPAGRISRHLYRLTDEEVQACHSKKPETPRQRAWDRAEWMPLRWIP